MAFEAGRATLRRAEKKNNDGGAAGVLRSRFESPLPPSTQVTVVFEVWLADSQMATQQPSLLAHK